MKVVNYGSLERASGKTFRSILCALLEASKGNRVLVVHSTEFMSKHAFGQALDMSHHYFRDATNKTIRFDDGFAKFISVRNLRGPRPDTLILDLDEQPRGEYLAQLNTLMAYGEKHE